MAITDEHIKAWIKEGRKNAEKYISPEHGTFEEATQRFTQLITMSPKEATIVSAALCTKRKEDIYKLIATPEFKAFAHSPNGKVILLYSKRQWKKFCREDKLREKL